MKRFLLSLFGGSRSNKPILDTAEATVSKRRTAADSNLSSKKRGGNPIGNTPSLSDSTPNPEHKSDATHSTADKSVITSMGALPFYEGVLASKDEGFDLNIYQKSNYVVLISDKKLKSVAILCSIEGQKESGLDNNYLAVKEMCVTAGYHSIRKLIANSQVIQLIYEENKKKSVEKQLEEAEGLQKDFNKLIADALAQSVSDIHIEVRRDEARVRFRKNGFLKNHSPWTTSYARTMATVIYQVIAAEQDVTFNESLPQAALIDTVVSGTGVRVRLNTIPTYPSGFDMIMRILKMGASLKPLPLFDLGYDEDQVEDIEQCISDPVGGTLVAGTTGSGKTTSLASMVSLKTEQYTFDGDCHIKIIAVEDPPEIELKNVSQVPVQRSKEANDGTNTNPFVKYMNATLRSDPDAILVGEVRDDTTAHLLQHAIQSGHQVFSTLHTSSAIAQIDRLRYMGIKSKVLGSKGFISGLIYQALVPVICKHCALNYEQFAHENKGLRHRVRLLERMSRVFHEHELPQIRFQNKSGCDKCTSGIAGRTVVAEVIVPTKQMREFFSVDEDGKALDLYLENGGKLILDHGISKILAGICDPVDIEHKLGSIDMGVSKNLISRMAMVQSNKNAISQDGSDLDITAIDFESLSLGNKEPSNVMEIGGKK
jgi:type II secretory ATPase GspE/PulE/Tfp pilus assembly ATPase PilB-like protein